MVMIASWLVPSAGLNESPITQESTHLHASGKKNLQCVHCSPKSAAFKLGGPDLIREDVRRVLTLFLGGRREIPLCTQSCGAPASL